MRSVRPASSTTARAVPAGTISRRGAVALTRYLGTLLFDTPALDIPTFAAMSGLLLLVAGFGFKMSVVPFHAWSPDTYQGAPTPFVAFLSVAPKVASLVCRASSM